MNRVYLSKVQFFNVCQELIQNKDWFLSNRPNYVHAARKLSVLMGYKVSPRSIVDLQQATGVTWERKSEGDKEFHSRKAIKIVADAVAALYASVGSPLPENLRGLLEHYKETRT